MPNVVVVEDNADIRLLLRALLDEAHQVAEFENGPDALAGLNRAVPDVVLLDISLPGLSGPGLLTVFGRVHPWLPVIVVTSTVDPRILARIADHKPFHLVNKPYDLEALDRLVAAAADESRTRAGRPAF